VRGRLYLDDARSSSFTWDSVQVHWTTKNAMDLGLVVSCVKQLIVEECGG